MCQLCDRNEEHVLIDCEDVVTLLHGDASARRLIQDMQRRRVEVEKLQTMLGFD
jgi:hypothetical protein